MYDLLTSLGRTPAIINLDPAANPTLPYPCAIDIRDLITLSDVQSTFTLGPNGGILYCMEALARNVQWLEGRVRELAPQSYLLFDFPGQVEVYSMQGVMDGVFEWMKKWSQHFTVVHLIDSYHLQEPSVYLSSLLLSLSSMVRLELPHVNVLSKVDQLKRMQPLYWPMKRFLEAGELSVLAGAIEDQMTGTLTAQPYASQEEGDDDDEEFVEFETGEGEEDEESEMGGDAGRGEGGRQSRYFRLTRALCELVESYSMVSFTAVSIVDKSSVLRLLHLIDTSNGYAFTNTTKEMMEKGQQGMAGAEEVEDDGGYSMFDVVNAQDMQGVGKGQQYHIREHHVSEGEG